MTPHASPAWVAYVIPAVLLAVLALRLRGLSRGRRLRLETLWIVPAVLAAAFVASLAQHPPRTPGTWILLALALGIGCGIGWRRAKLMRIAVDPATHRLNQQASPAALLMVVLLLVARQALRYEAAAMGLDLAVVMAVLLAFAVGLVAATRAEMALRARRLLRAARAA